MQLKQVAVHSRGVDIQQHQHQQQHQQQHQNNQGSSRKKNVCVCKINYQSMGRVAHWYLQGGGDVITGTNSNEHPRLESVSDSRFSINITKTNSLRNHNFICSSFVKPVSIVNVCEPSKNKIKVITTNDANILRLPMINNINNTNCDNLTTIDSICDYKHISISNSNINTIMPTSSTSLQKKGSRTRKVNESNIPGTSENTEDNVVTS